MNNTLFAKCIKTTELTEVLYIQLRTADSKRPTLGACTQIWLNMLAICDAWEPVKCNPVQIDGKEVPAFKQTGADEVTLKFKGNHKDTGSDG